jgi:hypothetical protein
MFITIVMILLVVPIVLFASILFISMCQQWFDNLGDKVFSKEEIKFWRLCGDITIQDQIDSLNLDLVDRLF